VECDWQLSPRLAAGTCQRLSATPSTTTAGLHPLSAVKCLLSDVECDWQLSPRSAGACQSFVSQSKRDGRFVGQPVLMPCRFPPTTAGPHPPLSAVKCLLSDVECELAAITAVRRRLSKVCQPLQTATGGP
jgi:hypothetical protein